jgi:hypothetical protein
MGLPLKLLIVAALAAGTAFAFRFMLVRNDGGGIEGRWKIITLPDGWKPLPGTQVIITNSEIRICVGELPTATLYYTIDQEHGTIDARRKVNGGEEVRLASYRREGDTLTLSVGAAGKPRPESPDVAEGTERWVLERKGD